MIVNESWLATELCLAMFAAGLFIIAMVCGKTARAPDDLDLDGEGGADFQNEQ